MKLILLNPLVKIRVEKHNVPAKHYEDTEDAATIGSFVNRFDHAKVQKNCENKHSITLEQLFIPEREDEHSVSAEVEEAFVNQAARNAVDAINELE